MNLDLGLAEVIMTNFGIWIMREKSTATLMAQALNGIRTEFTENNEIQLEFDESLKNAADKVDPYLYSYIWLISMAEKYEVVKIRNKKIRSSRENSSFT